MPRSREQTQTDHLGGVLDVLQSQARCRDLGNLQIPGTPKVHHQLRRLRQRDGIAREFPTHAPFHHRGNAQFTNHINHLDVSIVQSRSDQESDTPYCRDVLLNNPTEPGTS
jgi:hypothetical protein